MPGQPTTPNPSGSALSSDYTADEIIAMFKELGLPVCDDGDAIKKQFEDKRKQYLNWLSKPDPEQRRKGTAGVKNGEALQNHRPELLKIVYERFAGLADTALLDALASGRSKLTDELMDSLRKNQATKACHVDNALADRFLVDYMRERGLKKDGIVEQPGLMEDFTAVSGLGKVSLHWTPAKDKWDEVEIVRSEVSLASGKKGSKKETTVYRGRDETSFVDGGVAAGVRYEYSAHSIFRKIKDTDNDIVVQAVCLGEVLTAVAAWQEGRMHLSWELPGKGVSVLIFRSTQGAPEIRMEPNGPTPADQAAEQVYRSGGTSWNDMKVAEGVTYHYRLVADFGQNLFTEGVVVQATVPQPPPPVAALTATYSRNPDGTDIVYLDWPPAPGPMEYVVVRRDGNTPAAQVGEGKIIITTSQTRHLDEDVVAGSRYTYAVFTRLGDLYSRTGTTTLPVDILAEVTDLKANVADGTVELEWQTPPNVTNVRVRRSLNLLRDHNDGTPVKLIGTGHAKDDGLRNGQLYHYLVCCGYKPDGTTEVFCPGVRITVVPVKPPEQPIQDFAAQAQVFEIVLTWTPPTDGQVVIARSAAEPQEFPFGKRLTAEEVNVLGKRIVTTESGRAVDTQPDSSQPYYSIFTLVGPYAISGGTQIACVDVGELKLLANRESLILRWTWPPGCKAVKVARRANTWPENPDDQQALRITCTRAEYKAAGDQFLDKIEAGSIKYHYVVYAQVAGAPDCFAPGIEPGCRAHIQWEHWMTLRYGLSQPGKGSHKGKDILLSWDVETPFPNFAGFVLIASQTGIPVSASDGVEIYRWEPGAEPVEGSHEAWVSLAPIQQRRWARFFCKALALDPAQRHATLIIHPNVCVPISDTGEMGFDKPAALKQRYSPGIPRTVICPQCFDEFPLERMLFDAYGGEAMTARHTWLDRVLSRPPQPPQNKQGQLLTRKLCPNHQHVLPFTAGAQTSLVIGLIGAKFSGKSHYIASLIKRLESQVGSDLQAGLLPVTDETQERYQRDFYKPLFGNGLELPVTVGAPSPLIYDLTIDGRLFGEKRNRAVTLAFYDTAGENLQDANIARQMVQYLKVASGIMFLVDPLQVQEVREQLPASVQPPMLDQEAAPNQIIANVLQLLENGEVVKANTPLSIPVAVALTKCDVLRDAGLIDANRLWSTDKRHIGYFDAEAHQDMVGMMGEYFQRWDPGAYSNIQQRFSRHAFFGVSATGCASDQATRRYKFISPWRVEDPLLWLLAELGVIPVR